MGEFANRRIPHKHEDEPRKLVMNINGRVAKLKESEYAFNQAEIEQILAKQEPCKMCSGAKCSQSIDRMVPVVTDFRGFYSMSLANCKFNCQSRTEERKVDLVNRAHIPKRFEKAALAQFKTTDENKKATALALMMANGSRFGKGMYIYGPKGTGKTLLASMIGNAWLEKGKSVVFVSVQELAAKLRNAVYSSSRVSLKEYQEAKLLILDDLGAEILSEWAAQQLVRIVDIRYRELRPTIVTSNYSLQDLSRRFAKSFKENDEVSSGQRLISRLTAMCVPAELPGEDWRTEGTLFA